MHAYLHARLRALTGGERLQMATRMFATAKTLAEARARALGVPEGPALKLAVLRHLYGAELSEEQYAALFERYARAR